MITAQGISSERRAAAASQPATERLSATASQPATVRLSATERPASTRTPRLRSLDGLRGVAALIVVVHHSLLMIPALAAPYFNTRAHQDTGPLAWLMTYTPLHLLWEGEASVYVFFVLSGIVLTLPVLRSTRFSWRAYYPQRLVRLYLPVWAAIVFAVITITAVPRVGTGISEWLAHRPTLVTPARILRDSTLVNGAGSLASPLWSLQWEVIFSLALPVFVVLAVMFRRLLAVKVVLIIGVVLVSAAYGNLAVFYLSMFLIGTLIATEIDRLRTLGDRIDAARHPRLVWTVTFMTGLLLMNAYWLVMITDPPGWMLNGSRGIVLLGAVLVVFVAMAWSGARRVLEHRVLQWLGAISFSLYLVHEPILIASAFVFGPSLLWAAIPVGIVVAFGVTIVFRRFVESPSHRLAQAVKRLLTPNGLKNPSRQPPAVSMTGSTVSG